MNLLKRAQAATEYLIVLAVVIIIALIVVGVMGGIPGIGGGARTRSSASFWAAADVAITDYAMSAANPDTLILRNNLRNAVDITAVSVDGTVLTAVPGILGPGGTTSVTEAMVACTAGQAYSYAVSITYEDQKTGAEYTFTGDGNNLEGTCAT